MYIYDEYDQRIVEDRARQFRDQVRRYLAGELSETEFLPLRLQNGLYVQRYAPMLRIAVPYGVLSSQRLRKLAYITRRYDKGYAHITTRQHIQLNWPDLLEELASVQMHAIQTSGNCIRNTTTDQFAGVAADEIIDPRPWCEIVRQWSTFHPEFAFLPRKFKIAINGAREDRAAIGVHDIGLNAVRNEAGELGFQVLVGGGLGRTPMVGAEIRAFLPWPHLLTYLEAILRVYNRYGRRDNKFKARIKILVKALTPEVFGEKVEAEWQNLKDGPATLTESELQRVSKYFVSPELESFPGDDAGYLDKRGSDKGFNNWASRNVHPHRAPGYAAVTLSLKPNAVAPGDITAEQLEAAADLAEQYSLGDRKSVV